MNQIQAFAGILLLAVAVNTAHAGNSGGLEGALRQVVEQNLAAYNAKDTSETLASIHTKSPVYATMREALPSQFGALDARTAVEDFSYIGHDDEFAIARVQYRTEDKSTQPFMDNVMDTITVFHQEDGTWKYWNEHVLGVQPNR